MRLDKATKGKLDWYLKVIKIDFDRLSQKEREEFRLEVENHFNRTVGKDDSGWEISMSDAERFQKGIKETFELVIEDLKFQGESQTTPELSVVVKIRLDDKDRISVETFFRHYDIELTYDFIASLDGLSFSSFKRCPECRTFFFHSYRYSKIYCSNRCASRYINRAKFSRRGPSPSFYAAKPRI